jgi:hypothetical protein
VKTTLKILAVLAVAIAGFSQDIIRNPAKPLNPNAGRALKLEPVFEIKDESGEFYFKYPYRFDLDSRAFFYVLDEGQLLKFSPEGQFVRNFYKKGQGPGEIATRFNMVSFLSSRDVLYVYDGRGKIIRLDNEGKLIGEVRQTAGQFYELLGMCEKGFFMRGQTDVPWGGAAGFKEIETQIYLVSLDGSSAEKIVGFTSRIYQGPNFGMDWDNYLQVFNPGDGALYVSRTCEYRLERADLLNRKTAPALTREYPRVPFVISDNEKDFYEKFHPPKKDYANDIAGLFSCDGNLWVKTSTSDKDKGTLFDVFDPQGRFLDSFYLNKDLSLVLAQGDFIYVTERDKEGTISIKKFRVLNGLKSGR